MRVLFVVHGYPPAATGGTEIYCRELAEALVERRDIDEVSVVAASATRDREEFSVEERRVKGVRLVTYVSTYRTSLAFQDSYANPRVTRTLARIIADIEFDVAHIHHLTHGSLDCAALLAARAPVVVTLHDYWLMCPRGQLLNSQWQPCGGPESSKCAGCIGLAQRRLGSRNGASAIEDRMARFRDLAGSVDCFLCPSDSLRQRFLSFGGPEAKLRPWRLGHRRPTTRVRLEATGGRRERALRVGFFGTMMVSKAPHVAIRAAERFDSTELELHVVGRYAPYHGDDSYRAQIASTADNIVFHGLLDHSVASELMQTMDVIVVPSVWEENAPLVLSEAFLRRVPVVASNIGGLREMIRDGVDGALLPPGDVDALESCLRELVEDPERVSTLRRAIVEPPTIDSDAANHLELYRKLRNGWGEARADIKLVAVIPYSNYAEGAVRAARSLPMDVAVVFVSNGSSAGEETVVRRAFPSAVHICRPAPLGFARAANLGAEAARGFATHILFLNSDAWFCVGDPRTTIAKAPTRAAVLSPTILRGARIEARGIRWCPQLGRFRLIDSGRSPRDEERLETVNAVPGTAMIVEANCFRALGGFDPVFTHGLEDIDFCLRARAWGFESLCDPAVRVQHEGAATIGANSYARTAAATSGLVHLSARHGTGGLWRARASATLWNFLDVARSRRNKVRHLKAVIDGVASIRGRE